MSPNQASFHKREKHTEYIKIVSNILVTKDLNIKIIIETLLQKYRRNTSWETECTNR